ncbi:MAG TPA: FAD-binding oxidoreductase, partial [Steroidobacteraceae bacterium]
MLRFHPLEVAALRVEPEEAVYLSFTVPAALREEYRFEAGQHIGIRAMLDGEEVRRTYSLVNAPGGDTLQIGVRLHAQGRMSQHLARNVRAGDRLEILTPNGSFHSRAPSTAPRTVVAFAAGCGITPTLSIVRAILATSPASRVLLFYGNRTTSRIMLLEDLQALKDQFVGQLSLQFLFSGEPQEVELFNGRIDAAKVRELGRVLFDAGTVDEFFICGPGDMNEQVAGALQGLGVPAERIHSERFTATLAAV